MFYVNSITLFCKKKKKFHTSTSISFPADVDWANKARIILQFCGKRIKLQSDIIGHGIVL